MIISRSFLRFVVCVPSSATTFYDINALLASTAPSQTTTVLLTWALCSTAHAYEQFDRGIIGMHRRGGTIHEAKRTSGLHFAFYGAAAATATVVGNNSAPGITSVSQSASKSGRASASGWRPRRLSPSSLRSPPARPSVRPSVAPVSCSHLPPGKDLSVVTRFSCRSTLSRRSLGLSVWHIEERKCFFLRLLS